MLRNIASAVLLSGALSRVVSAQVVYAHFMAANSYSYGESDWQNDITTASKIGIDGFVLNLNADDYEAGQLDTAYSVAESQGNFSLLLSFDLSYTWNSSDIVSMVAAHASSSAQAKWNGEVLVSSYSGEAMGDSFWAGVKSDLSSQGITISFAPAFTTYRDPSLADQLLSTFPSIDGFFNWWSWPNDTDTNLTTATDLAYQSAINGARSGPYIMGVSPWQFKELGGDMDWVEYSDTLWDYRWLQAIQDVKPDIVEIITWNDYAESHYIGDINPNVNLGDLAPLYVNGFVHAPWRIMAQYFISWYKTGSAPAITTDEIIFWYRSHPKAVTCSQGDVPRNSAFPEDAIFAFAMVAQASTVGLYVGSNSFVWNAPAGVSMGSVPFPPEDSQIPYIQILRDGVNITGYGSEYITNACDYYNFNPFVGVVPNNANIE